MKFKKIGAAIGISVFCLAATGATLTPFANNNGAIPPAADYKGPLFKLSHEYPATAPRPAMPWRAAINNERITVQNAPVYAQALKEAVSRDMRVLLFDYAHWDAAKRGWYNEPWLGAASPKKGYLGREAIHGMYVGSSPLDASLFSASGLTKDITTYVLTYYDRTAAQTLHKVWGKDGTKPNITPASTQFAEGSIIIKAAFITADPTVWPVMAGSQPWPLYITENATTGNFPKPKVFNTYLMQFDIIVKDSASAPDTGWVFSTLVYDKDAKPGPNGIWDQMVVLGAQWGNDPQANSTVNPVAPLLQNWNNPSAPAYGGATFGWGERLSGPNDGAMNNIFFMNGVKSERVTNAKDSSCMSCHSTAQWNVKNPKLGMPSFLLPLTTARPQPDKEGYLNSPPPGSTDWLRWFQNRKGSVPMDAGSVAGDFDMVLTFKSLPLWYSATSNSEHALDAMDLRGRIHRTPAVTTGK